MTEGPIDFGIGVGWNKEEVEACGYGWEDRGARCDEFLEVMQLWTEPVVDFAGKWVRFETCRLDPKPIQKPHVPIIVGGCAEPALRRAVRFGAGWYHAQAAGAMDAFRKIYPPASTRSRATRASSLPT